MKTKFKDGRGRAGAKALKENSENKIKENKKLLINALRKFRDNKLPLIKSELAKEAGLSISTLNREPYKGIIKEYLEEEKVLLSPNAKHEIAELFRENARLKDELKFLQEKYKRLKKEINYSKDLFG